MKLEELVAGQHQLRDEHHDTLERGNVDADGLGPLAAFGGAGRGGTGLRRKLDDRAWLGRPIEVERLELRLEFADQRGVVAGRLGGVGLDLGEDDLDAVDGREDQRHHFRGRRPAVAKAADHRLRRMSQALPAGSDRGTRRSL